MVPRLPSKNLQGSSTILRGGGFGARNLGGRSGELHTILYITVPKTDTGGHASNAKTIGIMISKELCKITA